MLTYLSWRGSSYKRMGGHWMSNDIGGDSLPLKILSFSIVVHILKLQVQIDVPNKIWFSKII